MDVLWETEGRGFRQLKATAGADEIALYKAKGLLACARDAQKERKAVF